MLNKTKAVVEFTPDPDMYILFEKGKRGMRVFMHF